MHQSDWGKTVLSISCNYKCIMDSQFTSTHSTIAAKSSRWQACLNTARSGLCNKRNKARGRERVPDLKIHIFGDVPLVKLAFQGLNIMLLGSLQPTDIKNKVAHLTLLARELMSTHTTNSERNKTHGKDLNAKPKKKRNSSLTKGFDNIFRIEISLIDR